MSVPSALPTASPKSAVPGPRSGHRVKTGEQAPPTDKATATAPTSPTATALDGSPHERLTAAGSLLIPAGLPELTGHACAQGAADVLLHTLRAESSEARVETDAPADALPRPRRTHRAGAV